MLTAVSVALMEAELAVLVDGGLEVVRSEPATTITFTASSLSLMITLTEVERRVRIDGWVTGGGIAVQLLTGAEVLETVSDATGRLVWTSVPHGPVRFRITRTGRGQAGHHSEHRGVGERTGAGPLRRGPDCAGTAAHRPGRPSPAARHRGVRPDDVELRLRIRISSTWVTFERQGLDAALAVLDRLRRSSSRAGLPAVTAAAAVQGGIFRARGGDLRGAWRVLSRIDGAALPDPDRVRFLVNRATLASELRRLDEAAADLMEATELARSLELLPLAFIAGHNLGWVQFLRGDLPAALAATGRLTTCRSMWTVAWPGSTGPG
ncbi:hypothetical protein G7085_06505 [Tessaracoccus sp. HDW20]|uniref:hypothetical protein n=1 Tax=Tessaracoccus coleopterorum TaxID=2714950 RepID=UPI0018D4CCF2|nr:hypothetical protein [Tessaracoccus coleopterorum]NHB84377.1 hypothetical protein [Tessaracoccus coleopterorum]